MHVKRIILPEVDFMDRIAGRYLESWITQLSIFSIGLVHHHILIIRSLKYYTSGK